MLIRNQPIKYWSKKLGLSYATLLIRAKTLKEDDLNLLRQNKTLRYYQSKYNKNLYLDIEI